MGEYANIQLDRDMRRGIPMSRQYDNPTTTKAAIAHQRFKIVQVSGGNTNRVPGTKLMVTDQDARAYWVWASNKVSGIDRAVCEILHDDLSLNEALVLMGRKPYTPQVPMQVNTEKPEI